MAEKTTPNSKVREAESQNPLDMPMSTEAKKAFLDTMVERLPSNTFAKSDTSESYKLHYEGTPVFSDLSQKSGYLNFVIEGSAAYTAIMNVARMGTTDSPNSVQLR